MYRYTIHKDPKTGDESIETALRGRELLASPLLNKGTAFSVEERANLGLLGKLPTRIETLEEQVKRIRVQFDRFSTPVQQYIYLNSIHDKNEVLFYRFLSENLKELLPMIYTPGVGSAVKEYSQEFRQPRGLYLSYPDKDKIKQILQNRMNQQIDIVAVTDGEAVLGIGDQGIGSIAIPIAKLIIYSLCGISPYNALPVVLDVGTDNEILRNDPLYLGWRHQRLRGEEYEDFINTFVDAIAETLPDALLHCEDFGHINARHILAKHGSDYCVFNDDIQGTGVITLAAVLAAVNVTNVPLENHRVIIFGAGTAGVGIADQLLAAMVRQGMPPLEAAKQFWLINKQGLIVEGADYTPDQKQYIRSRDEINMWKKSDKLDLLTVVQNVKPTILIGCSTSGGAFSKQIVEEMAKYVERPIIFALSNPNENAEASPEQLIKWTKGKGLLATGSPFPPVNWGGSDVQVAQCNNALAFPGIGLGVVATKAKKITDNMLWVASKVLSELAPIRQDSSLPLLPNITDLQSVSLRVGEAVAEQAIQDNVAREIPKGHVLPVLESLIWKPYYRSIRPANNGVNKNPHQEAYS